MYSDGLRLTHGTSRRRLRHSLSKRHMWAGTQVKPASSSVTRRPGNWSKTPSLIMLVSCVAKTWAMPTYSSKKYDGQPDGVGGCRARRQTYLEFSIDRFTGEQQKFREEAIRAFGASPFAAPSFGALEELTRKNMAAFSKALGMFTPFVTAPQTPLDGAGAGKPVGAADIDELKNQLTEMQRRLDSIVDKR